MVEKFAHSEGMTRPVGNGGQQALLRKGRAYSGILIDKKEEKDES